MKQLTEYNRVSGYLNKIFDRLNETYFECTLSKPIITIQSNPESLRSRKRLRGLAERRSKTPFTSTAKIKKTVLI